MDRWLPDRTESFSTVIISHGWPNWQSRRIPCFLPCKWGILAKTEMQKPSSEDKKCFISHTVNRLWANSCWQGTRGMSAACGWKARNILGPRCREGRWKGRISPCSVRRGNGCRTILRGKNQSRRICRWLLRGERSGSLSGKFCWKFPMDRWLPTAGLQKRRPSVWAGQVCPARRWAVQWDTIPFPSSFPATGW